jgi:hypothetical protein
MSKFEPKKTEDMSALESLEDRDLLYTCSQSSYMNNLCDNTFFKRRFMKRWPQLDIFVLDNKWRETYLNQVSYIDKLRAEYSFNYKNDGELIPRAPAHVYYQVLRKVFHPFETGDSFNTSLRVAFENNYYDIIKYLSPYFQEGQYSREWNQIFNYYRNRNSLDKIVSISPPEQELFQTPELSRSPISRRKY